MEVEQATILIGEEWFDPTLAARVVSKPQELMCECMFKIVTLPDEQLALYMIVFAPQSRNVSANC